MANIADFDIKKNVPYQRARQGLAPYTASQTSNFDNRKAAEGFLGIASFLPVVGDAAGLAADAVMYKNHPDQRTWTNAGITALGMLPFVPGAAVMKQIDVNEIEAILDADETYSDWGLRVIPKGYEVKVGDVLPPSKQWDDGIDTGEELAGTSTIGVRSGRAEKTVKQMLENNYFGDQVVLVRGKTKGYGEDSGEMIIDGAEVVSVYAKPPKQGR